MRLRERGGAGGRARAWEQTNRDDAVGGHGSGGLYHRAGKQRLECVTGARIVTILCCPPAQGAGSRARTLIHILLSNKALSPGCGRKSTLPWASFPRPTREGVIQALRGSDPLRSRMFCTADQTRSWEAEGQREIVLMCHPRQEKRGTRRVDMVAAQRAATVCHVTSSPPSAPLVREGSARPNNQKRGAEAPLGHA